MKGRAFIESLRGHVLGWPLSREQQDLLADAVEEADESFRDLIESECLFSPGPGFSRHYSGGWWDTHFTVWRRENGMGGDALVEGPIDAATDAQICRAISYLDRRGLIERKEGEPHMVRFVE